MRNGRRLPDTADAKQVAYSDYVIRIRPGILYQPHPALARDAHGQAASTTISSRGDLDGIHAIGDFKQTGTRELVAADYVHQIKRLAHPRLHSPIMQLMGEYIVGLKELAAEAGQGATRRLPQERLSRSHALRAGRRARSWTAIPTACGCSGKYPQFVYWLAMPFFAPMPPEADRFYAQPGMAEKNISLDWYPVGTGPYMLTVNNPNRQMVLERNPNYQGEAYPAEGEPGDAEAGLLEDAGKPLPFIDKVVFSLEKEQIPYWNKFLQGYYDASGISSDTFDQAVQFTGQGDVTLSEDMQERGIQPADVGRDQRLLPGLQHARSAWWAATASARASCGRRSRSPSTRKNSSRSSATAAASPRRARSRRASSATARARTGINPYVYDWVDGEPRAQADRVREEAARRGGLSRRARREDRPAAAGQSRYHRRPGRTPRRASTGTPSSSRRSACSW